MNILFIAGTDITIHPNHRSHHFISFLEKHASRIDVVSMTRFYSGPWPATPWIRLQHGLRQFNGKVAEVIEKKTGLQIMIRKLPGRLDPIAQDLWAYFHLGPLADRQYELCIFGNPMNVLLPLLLKRKGSVETIIYDDWDYYYGFDQSHLWKLLMKWREQLSVSSADVVISVGSLLCKMREKQGAARTLVIPNGVNYQLFSIAHKKRPHPPTLVYIGKLAEEYGIDISIMGFAQVLNVIPTARYLIIGYNEDQYVSYLYNLVSDLELRDSVVFTGPKRYEELPHYMAESDIGVSLFRPNDLMKYAFPLKVIEYMAAGLAVVGTNIGETEKLILEGESGKSVAFSSEAFASAVLDILGDDSVLKNCQENAKKYAKRYDWNSLFSSLFEIIDIRRTS
jgi:glycosyltransferase involved in cell wall biosynthesis